MKLNLTILLIVICSFSIGQTITTTDTIYHKAIIKQGKKNKVFLERNTTIQVIGKDDFIYEGKFEGISRTSLYIRNEEDKESENFNVRLEEINSIQTISKEEKNKAEYLLIPLGAAITAFGIGQFITAYYYKVNGVPLVPVYWTIGGIVASGIGIPMLIIGITNPPKNKNKVLNENWEIEYY